MRSERKQRNILKTSETNSYKGFTQPQKIRVERKNYLPLSQK